VNPFPKDAEFYDAFKVPHSVFAETDANLHKQRRNMLKPFFSRAALLKIEGIIHQRADVMVKKLERLSKSESSIDVIQAIRYLPIQASYGCAKNDTTDAAEQMPHF
jgi:cytochrome P450